tara:strand:+ start:277 stop:447 length:171 start_codon:yes stop_codon:yes gene_type:complete
VLLLNKIKEKNILFNAFKFKIENNQKKVKDFNSIFFYIMSQIKKNDKKTILEMKKS